MADEVIVILGAEVEGYTAQIKSAIGANDKLEQSANETSAQISKDFAQSGKAIQQAFAGKEVSKSLDQTKKSATELKAQIKALYDEEVRLLMISKNVATGGVGAVRKEAALLRSQLGVLSGELNKTGSEIEKAAKKGLTLTGQLRNLKNEISLLAASGQGGSKAFTDLTIKAARLETQIGDTRERVRVLASDTFKFDAAVQGVQAVAAAFAGVQGAIALFGAESEEINKALLKVQASLALVASAQEFANLVTGEGALKVAITTGAQTLYASSLGATTTALKIFRGALITTGLGALVVALGFVIAKLQQFAESSTAAAAAVKAANAAQIESSKALVKAQLELDVTRGKITQAEFDRQIALADFTNKLSAELLAQKRRVADAELEIESAKQKRLLLLITAPLVDANKVVRDAEGKKAAIIADGEKTIANLRGEFNKQEQKRILDANKKEIEDTKNKEIQKIQIELTYQTIRGELIVAQSKKRFADVAVLEAELDVLRNKDSIEAQKNLIKAKLKADLQGYELEFDAAKQANDDLEAAKATYLAKIKLTQEKASQDTIALTQETNKKILKSDEELTISQIGLIELRRRAREKEANAALDISKQIVTELFEFGAQLNANSIADLEASKEKELQAAGDNAAKRKEIEEKYLIEVRKLQRKQAISDKAQALFNIAINTATAISKAIPNPALVALAITLGAIQAATVAARPIPKFEKGGLVKGARHSQGGVLAELEGEEYITNRNATRKNRALLEAINTGKEKEFIYKRFQVPIIQASQSASINQKLNAKLDSSRMERELQTSRKAEKQNTKEMIKAIANNKSLRSTWN